MKRFVSVILSVVLAALTLCLCSCAPKNEPSPAFFMFASVRIKGNNDGTITAVAQNEFSVGTQNVSATLKIYKSEEYTVDVTAMQQIYTEHTDSLGFLKKLCATVEIDDGYYCAVLEYGLNDQTETLQSDTLHYDKNGKRI